MRRQINNSARTKPHSIASQSGSRNLDDLVTHSENTISSQATIYTNTQRNLSQVRSDLDDYEDIIDEEMDTLFITPEEERKIQNLLEFARKGKINANNAFEIPVKVVDPSNIQSNNMRFWKFASQLLGASMHIYDKRVENVFVNTNRMFESLSRIHIKPEFLKGGEIKQVSQEEAEEASKHERSELIKMSMEEFKKNENFGVDIGGNTLQQSENLDIKDMHSQFIEDPLFYKKLKAFDTDTLKSLFLNVFECGKNLQIKLFNKSNDQQSINTPNQYQSVSNELQNQIEKSSQILKNSELFVGIDSFKKRNLNEHKEQQKDLQLFNRGDSSTQNDNDSVFAQIYDEFKENKENQHNFHNQSQTFNYNLQDTKDNQVFISESEYASERNPRVISDRLKGNLFVNSYFFNDQSENGKHESMTVMTPWEYQFKGLKLQKKRIQTQTSRNSKEPKAKKEVSIQIDIQFDPSIIQSSQTIFKRTKNEKMNKFGGKIKDNHLQAISMNVYSEFYNAKASQLVQKDKIINFDLSMMEMGDKINDHNVKQDQTFKQNAFEPQTVFEESQPLMLQGQNISSEGLQNLRTYGLRNIRQIKQHIYQQIVDKQSICISQLNYGISPASMMVIFLHLMNQKDLTISSNENQTDLQLTLQ